MYIYIYICIYCGLLFQADPGIIRPRSLRRRCPWAGTPPPGMGNFRLSGGKMKL